MNRKFITSLEPYLGDYLIVWDSVCCSEYREDSIPILRPGDGMVNISYAKLDTSVKEQEPPAPSAGSLFHRPLAENAVITLRDSYIGISCDRTSTTVKPAAFSVRRPLQPWSNMSSASSTDSDTLNSASSRLEGSPFWRFDWKRRAPLLGFHIEGLDLTANEGHLLSFTHDVDDTGCPFAVIELRGMGDVGYIMVLAKKQSKRSRKYLSLRERMTVGMAQVQCYAKGDLELANDLHNSLKKASKLYIPRKPFDPISL